MNKKKGQSVASFDYSFQISKRRKTSELRKSSSSELAHAALMNLCEKGQMITTNWVQKVALFSPRIFGGDPKPI